MPATVNIVPGAAVTYPTPPMVSVQVNDALGHVVVGTVVLTVNGSWKLAPGFIDGTASGIAFTLPARSVLPGSNSLSATFVGSGSNAGLTGSGTGTLTVAGMSTTISNLGSPSGVLPGPANIPISVTGTFAGASIYDYPLTFLGQNYNVAVLADLSNPSYTAQMQAVAANCIPRLFADYSVLQSYFGSTATLATATMAIVIRATASPGSGTGGAIHNGASPVCYCDACFSDPRVTSALFIEELTEVGESLQNLGWSSGDSNGEALSQVLAQQLYPGVLESFGYSSANNWLTQPAGAGGQRPNYIDFNAGSDRNQIANGCGKLFLYWLAFVGFTYNNIVQAGGRTMAETYRNLTGLNTAFADFNAAVNSRWPINPGAYFFTNDNLWLSETVPPPGPVPATPGLPSTAPQGDITVAVDGQPPVSTTMILGQATASVPLTGLAEGTHQLTMNYHGQGVYAPAATQTALLTVKEVNSVNFETGDFSQCLSSQNAKITRIVALWGTYSCWLQRFNSAAYVTIGANSSASFSLPTAYYRFYFMYQQRASSGGHTAICGFQDTSSPALGKAFLHLDGNGHLQFYDRNGVLLGTGTSTLQAGTVYMISGKIGTGTSASWELLLNGNVELAGTGDMRTSNNGSIKLGGDSNYTDSFFYDEVAVNSSGYPAAVVLPAAGVPSGSIQLFMDGIDEGTQPLDAQGTTTFTIFMPAAGTHQLAATLTSTNFQSQNVTGTLFVIGGVSPDAAAPQDVIGISEVVKNLVTRGRGGIAANVGVSDRLTIVQQVPNNPILRNNTGFSDAISRFAGYSRAAADSAGVAEKIIAGRTSPVSRADNFGVAEKVTAALGPFARTISLTNNFGIGDQVSTFLVHARIISVPADSVGIAEAVARSSQSQRKASDVFGISDSVQNRYFANRLPRDNVGLRDLITIFVPAHPQSTDIIGVTDSVSRRAIYYRQLADNIGVAESIPARLQPLLGITMRWRLDSPIGRWRKDNAICGQHWYLVRAEDKAIYVVSDAGPVDITGWHLRWQVRAYDGPVPIVLTCDSINSLLVIADARNGLIQINLRSWQTARLAIQQTPWYWELVRRDQGNYTTLARGTLEIDQENATP